MIGSAFTAYVPGKSGSGSGTRTSPAKQYTGLDNLRSRTSYLTSLGQGEERCARNYSFILSHIGFSFNFLAHIGKRIL